VKIIPAFFYVMHEIIMNHTKQFPDGMVPLGMSTFKFACHSGVECFTSCCRKLDMFLYPYDIIRLKNRLAIGSEDFMRRYTRLGQGSNPYFPAVLMRMLDNREHLCPFLSNDGCTVYADRPSACRTYPLERAVDRYSPLGRLKEYYFLTNHSYCCGHKENTAWTVREWIRDQKLLEYNEANDLWAEMDTLFSGNPWQGEGVAGPKQQLAFMVCYNVDGFRQFVKETALLEQFKLDKARKRIIARDDESLLAFGFDWLKLILGGKSSLQPRTP